MADGTTIGLARWEVPSSQPSEAPTPLMAEAGRCLMVVGRNGAGKSALSYWMATHAQSGSIVNIRRILGHRRVWLNSSGPDVTAQGRRQAGESQTWHDMQAASRIKDDMESQRSGALLFDLLGRIIARDNHFVQAIERGQSPQQARETYGESLLDGLNRIFASAGLELTFSITTDQSFLASRKGASYPISDMSDGEKSAFLLASEILIAEHNCVMLVDEPERHFHRAISAQLITALIRERSDCAFVLFTHDLDLAQGMGGVEVTPCVVDEVRWNPDGPAGWKLRTINAGELPANEDVRKAVLGGRDRVLCVEGDAGSLDVSLYSLLFPAWSVIPSGSAEQVRSNVAGMKGTYQHHWVECLGIVDGDASGPDQTVNSRAKGILTLPVNEVESLYYLPWATDALAERQASDYAMTVDELRAAVTTAVLTSLRQEDVKRHLAAANAQKIMRRVAMRGLPDRRALAEGGATVSVTVESAYPQERDRLDRLIEAGDTASITMQFSVRDSPAPAAVAKALRYPDSKVYEQRVRVLLQQDAGRLQQVRDLVGDLPVSGT